MNTIMRMIIIPWKINSPLLVLLQSRSIVEDKSLITMALMNQEIIPSV
jgi:hypothetical protein